MASGKVAHRGIITVCAMVATLMQALDGTIANVALPLYAGQPGGDGGPDHLGADQLHHRRGHHDRTGRVWPGGSGGSGCSSSRSAASPSPPCCAARRNPCRRWWCSACCRASSARRWCRCRNPTMLDIYPPEQRGSAMAIWGMGVMVGPILGPTLGGWLTESYNWRWVFYVNLPFGILAFIGLMAASCRDRSATRRRLRLVRLRRAGARHRRAADHARPRRAGRLVRLHRDHHRGGARRARHLPVHRPHGDGGAAVHPAARSSGPQLRRRPRLHVRRSA